MGKDLSGKELPKGITQRSDGRYMARFVYKRKRYAMYDIDLKKLLKKLRDKQYEVEHGIWVDETRLSVNEWFEIWMREYKQNSVKYGTYQLYHQIYRLYIQDKIGDECMASIRPDQIQSIYNELSAEGHMPETISLTAAVMNGMFQQAYQNQMIQKNPVEFANKPKSLVEKKEMRVMSIEEQKIFREYASESGYYRLYLVGLGTGMRSGELRALEWEDVDFANRIIHVTGTLKLHKGSGYIKDTPKTVTSKRDIPMLDEVYRVLKEQKKEQAQMRTLLGEKWQPAAGLGNLVFTSQYHRKAYGIPIGDAALNVDLKKIVKKINEEGISFEPITPHTLRHTFATRGLERGIPPKVMQELLGHTSITMTMDTYSHVLPDMKAKEIQKLAGDF